MSKSTRGACILCMIILPSIIFAQEWVARYNGYGNGAEQAVAIAIDDLGNVYVTGVSVTDYATVKYDAAGVEQWVVRYNGPGNGYDGATAIAVDDQGNVYVTGVSDGSGSGEDYATVKYDAAGVEQWVVRYNGPGNGYDGATAIAVDDQGNVYVTGESFGDTATLVGDYATVKYDAAGIEQWVARYNGPANGVEKATAIAVDDQGNVYVAGYSEGLFYGGTDYATVKYDAAGIEQWVARYNTPPIHTDEATAIAVDDQGNVYVTGWSYRFLMDPADYVTVKYNSSGNRRWVAIYNGPGNGGDLASAIAVGNLGDVYVTGHSEDDYATVKYDAAGIEQWVARYNGPGNGGDGANAIAVDDLGSIYVTGFSDGVGTGCDYATVKYDSSGIEQWVARYNGPGNGDDGANAIAVDDLGNVYVTGYSEGSGTDYDYATIKYSPTGIEEDEPSLKKGNEITATIFRGPLQLPESKKCKVFDITGQIVESNKIAPGIYFVEIDNEVVQKVIKVR